MLLYKLSNFQIHPLNNRHYAQFDTEFKIEINKSKMFKILTIYLVAGYTFPTLKEADAMFMAEKAPEWKEGDLCARCRTRFGTFNRQV